MTTQIEFTKKANTYFYILSDGKFHTEAKEGDEGAIKREYETSDGKKGVKIEKTAEKISGIVTNLSLYDGDFGKLLQLSFGENELIVSIGVNSAFGEDLMKKIPNIDFNLPLTLAPYSFDDENGRKRKGITVYQNEVKIGNYYSKKDGDKYVTLNGYPEVPEDVNWDKEDWKIYFAQARKFLTTEITKHKLYNIKPNVNLTPAVDASNYPTDKNVDAGDVPW
jgi:hypothetical protein